MASSAENPHHHLPTPFGTTAAPPPTPSTQPIISSGSITPDFLSHLLHRLPPSLSLSVPSRRSSPLSSSTATATATATATPPVISLSDPTPTLHSALLAASTQLGCFHLTNHPIPSHLPVSAESTALSLFNLPRHQKQLIFPSNWPLGHDDDDDDDGATESFCLDSAFSAESTSKLELDSLREFSGEMEKLGLKVVEELASAVGFNNPDRNDLCSLLWVSDGMNKPGRAYPYVVALHYQINCEKQSLLSDSGWVSVLGRAHSVFVTIGDIAQVWSNGKLKKVRGRPFTSSSSDEHNINSHCITMSLLLSLPLESTVSPLVPGLVANDESDSNNIDDGEKRSFASFSFEDYAWRVYHERLLLKDPLVRYRV